MEDPGRRKSQTRNRPPTTSTAADAEVARAQCRATVEESSSEWSFMSFAPIQDAFEFGDFCSRELLLPDKGGEKWRHFAVENPS